MHKKREEIIAFVLHEMDSEKYLKNRHFWDDFRKTLRTSRVYSDEMFGNAIEIHDQK